METDKDHIHLMIQYIPRVSISAIVNRIKAISTKKIWNIHQDFLRRVFGKKKLFGLMVISYVQLERLVLKQFETISKIKTKAL